MEEYDTPSKISLLGVPVELTLCGGGRLVKQGAVLGAGAVTGSLGQRGLLIIVPKDSLWGRRMSLLSHLAETLSPTPKWTSDKGM